MLKKIGELLKIRWVQIPLAIVLVFGGWFLLTMFINYSFPSFFRLSYPNGPASQPIITSVKINQYVTEDENGPKQGLMFTDTLIVIGDDLFSNWLPNDKIWPTVALDNPQNFQLGQLRMMNYSVRVMRDGLVRYRSAAEIDKDCEQALNLLSNDPYKWWLPSAESRFQAAVGKLKELRTRMADAKNENELFSAREDNLCELLDQYVSLLGDVNTRLSEAPQKQRNKFSQAPPIGGDSDKSQDINQEDNVEYVPKVAWNKIDDNFYFAQGVAYVLRQVMVAVRYDFRKILRNKNAMQQIDSIIDVLDQAQFEPLIVLNGDVGSLTANHSMELHSLLENTRQKMRNLREMINPAPAKI